MKKATLLLLGLSVATMGFVSCEKEDPIINEQKPEYELHQRGDLTDSLDYYRTAPHGNKGEGKLGDD